MLEEPARHSLEVSYGQIMATLPPRTVRMMNEVKLGLQSYELPGFLSKTYWQRSHPKFY